MNPDPTHLGQRTIRKNRGVLNRNVALIVKSIGHPTAQRFERKPAFIHRDMERMFVVISAPADRAQVGDESFAIQKFSSHKTTSNPSHAISIPAFSTCRRSLEPGMTIGLVLLMCV